MRLLSFAFPDFHHNDAVDVLEVPKSSICKLSHPREPQARAFGFRIENTQRSVLREIVPPA